MERLLKTGLAILLFSCLIDMPYGYYQLVRFLATILFAFFAFKANQTGNSTTFFLYLILALLFQPVFKISLGRELWNAVDVIVAILLLVSVFIKETPNNNKKSKN